MLKTMFFVLLYFFLFFISDNLKSSNEITQEQTPPIIEIKPDSLFVSITEGKFLTRNLKVLNRGGEPLYIKSITSSCLCGSSKILAGRVEPLGIGRIQLSVNTDGLYDGNNIVEFVVNSTAKNSPTLVKFLIDTISVDPSKEIIEK